MTRYQWDGSFKSFAYHLDPDKEEQLKLIKIETENEVKRVLKLNKNINHNNNKEKTQRIKSENIHLIEDFQKQYDSIYSLYEDLRDKVKNNLSDGDYDSEHYYTYSSDSDYHSSVEANPKKTKTKNRIPKVPKRDHTPKAQEESSDVEGIILKDKLTASTEIKKYTLQEDRTPDFGEIIKVVRIQGEDELEKTNQNLERIKDLEEQVESLKADISAICKEKTQLEEKISKLEAESSKLDITCKDNECKRKQYEDNEQQNLSRISDLTTKVDIMQIELNTLKIQKHELEGKLSGETEKWSSEVTGLKEQLTSLQNEFVSVNNQKAELDSEIKRKSEETSDCLLRIEALRNELTLNVKRTSEEKEGLKVEINHLEQQIQSLHSRKSELEQELKLTNDEASQLNAEKQKLQGKISKLQTSLDAKESELLTELSKFKASENTLSMQNKSLAEEVKNHNKKLENMQKDLEAAQLELEKEKEKSSLSKFEMVAENAELKNKIAHQMGSLIDLEDVVKKLKQENQKAESDLMSSKSSLHLVERKVEEMASEFRKEFEDKCRILSHRIRVAEQLQAETKEWWMNAKDTCMEENKDLKAKAAEAEIGFKSVRDMTLTANDVLSSLDSVAMKFEECADHFMNRISKSSCELKFAKNWATRKNRALFHMREEVDCLLQQLNDKEKETLVFRERVWKSENKVRELEKMLKEKEDAMLGFEEEKREAIRQLCVGIDYHRSRSDYYKKAMSDTSSGRKMAS